MSTFRFKVSDQQGKKTEVNVDAESLEEAQRQLRRSGFIVLDCCGVKQNRKHFFSSSKLDLCDFLEQLQSLLSAGVVLERAIAIMADMESHSGKRKILEEIRTGLHKGKSLSAQMASRPDVFPEMIVGAVAAGEKAGSLSAVLADVESFLRKQQEVRGFVLSASIYPLIVLVVSIFVILGMFIFVIPRFAATVAGMGIPLPWYAAALFAISDFFISRWYVVISLLLIFVSTVYFLWRVPVVKRRFASLLLRLPLGGAITRKSQAARFCRTLAVLLDGGVSITEGVETARNCLSNQEFRDSLQSMAGNLRTGRKFSAILSENPWMPQLAVQMVAVGEESGDFAAMLRNVSERLENDVRRNVQRLLSVFEPAMIVCIGSIISLVVISMLMTIVNMQTAF